MMPGMTESALETTAHSAPDSVEAPTAVDTATTPASPEPIAATAPEQLGAPVVVAPDGTTQTLHEFVGVDEPDQPELTDEQKKLHEFYTALDAWRNRFDPDWEHERVDFHGDYLAARKPTAAALTAVSLGTGKYIADQTRADFVGKFIELHLAPESYGQFLTRMMNPNEKDYGDNAFGDLVKALSEETADELAASADKG